MQEKIKWECRIAPSLGDGFEGTPQTIWGVSHWQSDWKNAYKNPTVFFGLYGLPDFMYLWWHTGRKCILWAGSDIRHFCAGYWLDKEGLIKMDPYPLARWINLNCESYVENEVEAEALRKMGITAQIVPSFLGNVDDFPLSYKPEKKVRLYTSVSGNDFKVYGWNKIYGLAKLNPEVEFHLYGNTVPFLHPMSDNPSNIIEHGRVPKEQMNAETKEMTGALRLTEFDGFSEIIAKSLLWGQWPVSLINYKHTVSPQHIFMLVDAKPNIAGREWLLSVVNRYPWNKNICQGCDSPAMEDFYHSAPKE